MPGGTGTWQMFNGLRFVPVNFFLFLLLRHAVHVSGITGDVTHLTITWRDTS